MSEEAVQTWHEGTAFWVCKPCGKPFGEMYPGKRATTGAVVTVVALKLCDTEAAVRPSARTIATAGPLCLLANGDFARLSVTGYCRKCHTKHVLGPREGIVFLIEGAANKQYRGKLGEIDRHTRKNV
jgi:hypothetical protein